MSQTIDLTNGAVEYTWPVTITEATGKDISADPVQISLGTYVAPGAWQSPDIDTPQTQKSKRVVQILIGSTVHPQVGTYYLWLKVTDSPEVVPRRCDPITII